MLGRCPNMRCVWWSAFQWGLARPLAWALLLGHLGCRRCPIAQSQPTPANDHNTLNCTPEHPGPSSRPASSCPPPAALCALSSSRSRNGTEATTIGRRRSGRSRSGGGGRRRRQLWPRLPPLLPASHDGAAVCEGERRQGAVPPDHQRRRRWALRADVLWAGCVVLLPACRAVLHCRHCPSYQAGFALPHQPLCLAPPTNPQMPTTSTLWRT